MSEKIKTYIRNCGNCKHWFSLLAQTDPEYPYGDCSYQVKFPDSLYARDAGRRKEMRNHDGNNCPCFEWKEDNELARTK